MRILKEFFTFVRPAAHSPYSPSSYDRWSAEACPASVRISDGIFLPEQDYTKRGTLAHSVAEAVFHKEAYFEEFPSKLLLDVGMWEREHPGDYANMLAHGYDYAQVIQEWMDPQKVGKILWHGLEKALPIIPEKNVYGTGDCIIIGTKAAVVIDYKYGQKAVAPDSPQLKGYAVAIWRHLMDVPADYKFYTVVHQPNVSPIAKYAEVPADEIKRVFEDMWRAVDLSKDLSCGPKEGAHCFWCPAKRTSDPMKKCPAIKDRAINAAAENFSGFFKDIKGTVTVIDRDYEARRNAAAVKLLLMKDFLMDTIKDLEEEYSLRVSQGEVFPELSMETEFGNREWIEKDPKVLCNTLRATLPGFEPLKLIPAEYKVKTITEIEKELKNKTCLTGLTTQRGKKVLKIKNEATINLLSTMLGMTTKE